MTRQVFALVMGFPWLLLQGLLFVGPALSERESRYIMPVTGMSLVLAICGAITALSYVSYAVWFLAAAAIAFQTPLVVLALVGMGDLIGPAAPGVAVRVRGHYHSRRRHHARLEFMVRALMPGR